MTGHLAIRKLHRGYNISAPGANTNIISTSLTPYEKVSTMRVTVVVATTSVFNVTMTQGATTFTCGLNSSVALVSGDLYTFNFECGSDTTYNFQVETDSIIRVLEVSEVSGGVI